MWLESVGSAKAAVLETMRRIRRESDAALERYRQLAPRHGEIPVGGAHFDEFLKGETLAALLRELSKGLTPEAAVEEAKAEARLMVLKWNKQRGKDYQTHRWEGTMDAKLMDLQRALVRSACVS